MGRIVLHILGEALDLTEHTTKNKTREVGNKTYVEVVACEPYWLLHDPRNDRKGIAGVDGTLADVKNSDPHLTVDGVRVNIGLVDGVTGKEGAKKRNPKISGSVITDVDGRPMKHEILVSQPRDGALYISAAVTNLSPNQRGEKAAPVSLSDIARRVA